MNTHLSGKETYKFKRVLAAGYSYKHSVAIFKQEVFSACPLE
jgi:hypothetical protein